MNKMKKIFVLLLMFALISTYVSSAYAIEVGQHDYSIRELLLLGQNSSYNYTDYSSDYDKIGVNLLVVDWENKPSVGSGYYRLQSNEGLTLDYNPLSGNYRLNGESAIDNVELTLGKYNPKYEFRDDYFSYAYYYVSGDVSELNGGGYTYIYFPFLNGSAVTEITFDYGSYQWNESNYTDPFGYGNETATIKSENSNSIYNNLVFRVQVNYGDVVLPYEVPYSSRNNNYFNNIYGYEFKRSYDNYYVLRYELLTDDLSLDMFRYFYMNIDFNNFDFDSDYKLDYISFSSAETVSLIDEYNVRYFISDGYYYGGFSPEAYYSEDEYFRGLLVPHNVDMDYVYIDIFVDTDNTENDTKQYIENDVFRTIFATKRTANNIYNSTYEGSGAYEDGYSQGSDDTRDELGNQYDSGYNDAKDYYGFYDFVTGAYKRAFDYGADKYNEARDYYGLYFNGDWQTATYMYSLGLNGNEFQVHILEIIGYVFAGIWGVVLTIALAPISTFGFTLLDLLLTFGSLMLLMAFLKTLGK